ncbi:unnamed protein product [Mytilus coruscus]|uniref:Tyr recombinase domain-containing protein n=1 Tax=Mytilus coruscus TaxID=42192 RepID=A0A6J8DF04_MYTCO|nr:unnamed protein product [Mytilus coruscus]
MSITPGLQGIRKGFEEQGLSERAISIMNSWPDSTAKQYTPHIVCWFNFAKDKDTDPFQPTIAYVLDFLAVYFQNAGYSALNTARSALSIACATIARWIKTVLKLAGIDADMFKAHSTRAASTSAAFLAGMPIKDILKAAGWSNESVFGRFYQKKIAPSTYLGDTILQ